MRTLSEIEIKKAGILKAYRTAIRLKYALMADEEIYRTLPELEDQIDRSLALGQPVEVDPGEAFRVV